jgi:signal peptidase II
MPLVSRSTIKEPDPQETLSAEARVRWDLIVAAIALGVIIIDQFTKALVLGHFKGQHAFDVVPIFGNILTLENWGNPGAAFSSFTQSPGLLAFLILIAVGVIGWMYWSTRPRDNPWLKATFGLIIGGAVGNLIDRLRLGYVVDFVHFQLPAIHFDFAVFNMADAAISIGVVALAIIFWTLPRESTEDAADGSAKSGIATAAVNGATSSGQSTSAKSSAMSAGAMPPHTTSAATKTPTNPIKTLNGSVAKPGTSIATKTPTNPVKTSATVTASKLTAPAPKSVAAGTAPKTGSPKPATAGKSKRKRR